MIRGACRVSRAPFPSQAPWKPGPRLPPPAGEGAKHAGWVQSFSLLRPSNTILILFEEQVPLSKRNMGENHCCAGTHVGPGSALALEEQLVSLERDLGWHRPLPVTRSVSPKPLCLGPQSLIACRALLPHTPGCQALLKGLFFLETL